MKKPTIADIQAYIVEKNYNLDPELMWHSYERTADNQGRWLVKSGNSTKPMTRWHSTVSLGAFSGWWISGKSTRDYQKRNERPDDRQKHRDDYEDYLRSMTLVKLRDLRKDPGALKHVVWLIEEVLADKISL